MLGGEKAEDCQRSVRGVGGTWGKIDQNVQQEPRSVRPGHQTGMTQPEETPA